MKRVKARPRKVRLLKLSLVAALVIAYAAPTHAQNESSVQEVLDQCRKAMEPPLQYTVRSNGIRLSVKSKTMPDGTHAVRTEFEQPVSRIGLRLGEDTYEIYPSYGVMIDVGPMLKSVTDTITGPAATLDQLDGRVATIKGTVVRDGRKCLEIETVMSPEARQAVIELLPPGFQDLAPGHSRLVIDRQTHELIETEVYSVTGTSVSKSEYSDFKRRSDVPDDLFLPPDGMEIKKPESVQEYVATIAAMFQPDQNAIRKQTEESIRLAKEESAKVTQAALDRGRRAYETALLKPAPHSAPIRNLDKPGKTRRWTMIVVLNLVMIALLVIAGVLKYRSNARASAGNEGR